MNLGNFLQDSIGKIGIPGEKVFIFSKENSTFFKVDATNPKLTKLTVLKSYLQLEEFVAKSKNGAIRFAPNVPNKYMIRVFTIRAESRNSGLLMQIPFGKKFFLN